MFGRNSPPFLKNFNFNCDTFLRWEMKNAENESQKEVHESCVCPKDNLFYRGDCQITFFFAGAVVELLVISKRHFHVFTLQKGLRLIFGNSKF